MSKRFASLLLSMVVIISLFHPTAYAALDTKITEATTKVTYTAKVQEGYYEVNIPKTADIGESEYMYFSANNVNIGENQLLTIRVNTDRTFTNGIFVLKNAFSEELETFLYRVDRNSGAEYSIDYMTNPIVATFSNGVSTADYLRVQPIYESISRPGEYTGYIYFTIAVEND